MARLDYAELNSTIRYTMWSVFRRNRRLDDNVFALVDDRAWYVLANFSETYMPSIKPGMEADVYLVSAPDRRFRGTVQGIGWANRPDDGATVGVLPEVRRRTAGVPA